MFHVAGSAVFSAVIGFITLRNEEPAPPASHDPISLGIFENNEALNI
ncbi:MAG TPA: hypothetical protein PLD02_15525 [Saprospiraceae bacterium]|nr:hypothetical protein [Saprospiraceae bacterium]